MADRRKAADGWHREDIKAALVKRYGSITHLSVQWGYARNAITLALLPTKSWAAIERRIADALDVSPHTLWPNRWTPEGERRSGEDIAGEPSRPRSIPHRRKSEAA